MISARISARETRRAWIVMILLIFIWGYAWVAAKIALRYTSPLDASVVRVMLGTLFLFVFLVWSKSPLRPAHVKWLIAVGVLQTAAFTIFNTLALERGEPGRISLLVFTMPFWVIAFAWPVLGERIRGWQWLAIAMALIGLMLVLQPWDLRPANTYWIDAPVIAAISSWLQLGERPAPTELADMLLIGIALALVSWRTIRRQERTEPMMAQE